jgi:hypothetical protein
MPHLLRVRQRWGIPLRIVISSVAALRTLRAMLEIEKPFVASARCRPPLMSDNPFMKYQQHAILARIVSIPGTYLYDRLVRAPHPERD